MQRTAIELTRYDRQMQLSDGRRLGYAEYGDPHGKPVVYFHGGLSSRLDGYWLHDAARAAKVRLLAVDRPGIGLSDRKAGRSLTDWAKDIRQFAERLSISRFPVLGWSCGAFYALACAHELGDIVTKAGTVGALGPPDEETVATMGLFEDQMLFSCPEFVLPVLGSGIALMKVLPPHVVKAQVLQKLKCQSDIEIVTKLSDVEASEFFYECVKNGGAGCVDDYLACRLPWSFNLQDITVPALLFHGAEDNIAPVSASHRLAGLMQNASRVIELPDLGHFLLCAKAEMIFSELLAA